MRADDQPSTLGVRARPTRKSSKRVRPSPRVKGSSCPKMILLVVTGAGGFIGGHLVRVLQQRGHTKIRAVDVKPLDEWYQKSPASTTRWETSHFSIPAAPPLMAQA